MAKTSTGSELQDSQIDYKALAKELLGAIPQSQAIDIEALTKAIKGEDKGNKHQSYGITQDVMKKIKEAQMNKSVVMIPANRVSSFEIPEHESKLMHFSTERVEYDSLTGEKKSKPRFHVKTPEDFIRMSKSVKAPGDKTNPENAFSGMKVIILHDARSSAEIKQSDRKRLTDDEILENMNEAAIDEMYERIFGEEALPSDTKAIKIQLIKEKKAEVEA